MLERNSLAPIAGAKLSYNPRRGQGAEGYAGYSSVGAVTAADGTFQLAAPPKTGTLAVLGPSEDYVLEEIGDRMIYEGKPGGRRVYAHAFTAYEPTPGNQSLEQNFVLRRGTKLEGRAIGPDGRLITSAAMISRLFLPPIRRGFTTWQPTDANSVHDGHFVIPGLDPDIEVPVYFLEPKLKLGASARFSGKSAAGGPVTVRLEPCGSARARLVCPDGKPRKASAGTTLSRIRLLLTPGAPRGDDDVSRLRADEGNLGEIDPINYEHPPAPDAEGRIVFPALVPGATYRLSDISGATQAVPQRIHGQAWRDHRPGRYPY